MDEYERLKAQKEEMLKRHESAKDKRIAELEVDIEGRSMIEQGLKERIRDLEYSIANHFTNEHLAGKGPEIDRWKRKVKELESELAAASEAFAEQDIKRHNMIKELEAELAKCAWHRHIEELEEDAQKFHGDMEKYKANNARLRECLKRLIDAHNNDADMDIYDQLIIEAAAEIAREGLKEKANPCP